MKKVFLLVLFVLTLFAKVDYSSMSNEELLALMGYVKPVNIQEFKRELNSRIPTFSEKEKNVYLKNLKKMK